jgi:hypothetical protein
MVCNAADLDRLNPVIAGNPGHVGPELPLQVFGDAFFAVLGAEDQMNPIAGI